MRFLEVNVSVEVEVNISVPTIVNRAMKSIDVATKRNNQLIRMRSETFMHSETRNMEQSWFSPIKSTSGLTKYDKLGYSAKYSKYQHDEALRHLKQTEEFSPMANLAPKLRKNGKQRKLNTLASKYSAGYKFASENGKLSSPVYNPFLKKAINESLDERITGIQKAIFKELKNGI